MLPVAVESSPESSCELPKALGVTRNVALRRILKRTMNAAGFAVELVDDIDPAYASDASLIVIDRDSRLSGVHDRLDSIGYTGAVIIVGDSLKDDDVIRVLRQRPLDHVITDLAESDERELFVTSAKVLSGDIFGLEKYLAWGVLVYENTIRSYHAKRTALAQVADYARALGVRRQLIGRLESVVDELLMNALYDAPAIRQGLKRQVLVDKLADGILPVDEAALLRYAADGHYLAISVEDKYGALQKAAILDNLTRARADRGRPMLASGGPGGAGLGLYFILSATTRFVANIDPGHRTEVICLFDLRQSGREADIYAQSLHIFHT